MAVLCLAAAAGGVATSPAARGEYTVYANADRGTEVVLNVDAIGAWYGSNGAWFGASEAFLGAHVDRWADLGIEPTLSLETNAGRGRLFAALSGVFASTLGDDASGSTVRLDDTSAMTLEQGHVGWRIADVFPALDGDTFSLAAGRFDYGIASGLLVDDGGADGGERGGWYLGMRKAFVQSLVASLDSETWLVEAFSLHNEPREGDTRGEARGANVEYRFDRATLGTTYLRAATDAPTSESLDAYSLRASWRAPSGFGLVAEHVDESSGTIDATGYYAEIGYVLESRPWSPQIRLRHARFSGDDPATARDERFREIAYGSTDWTSWYQGEITGEYALGNGNLESELVRLTLAPTERITVDAMYYRFALDQPASFGAASSDWGDELNFTVDWQVDERVSVTGVLAVLWPGAGAEQIVGGSSDWIHTMLLVSYSW
jgi:hypothetical protein